MALFNLILRNPVVSGEAICSVRWYGEDIDDEFFDSEEEDPFRYANSVEVKVVTSKGSNSLFTWLQHNATQFYDMPFMLYSTNKKKSIPVQVDGLKEYEVKKNCITVSNVTFKKLSNLEFIQVVSHFRNLHNNLSLEAKQASK